LAEPWPTLRGAPLLAIGAAQAKAAEECGGPKAQGRGSGLGAGPCFEPGLSSGKAKWQTLGRPARRRGSCLPWEFASSPGAIFCFAIAMPA